MLEAEAREKDAEIERLKGDLLRMRQKLEKALKAQQDLLRDFQARFQQWDHLAEDLWDMAVKQLEELNGRPASSSSSEM